MNPEKPECMRIAKKFDHDYWDGDRKYGYGGYHYDGRWATIAKNICDHYKIGGSDKVLDIGCGKAHLLYEMVKYLPNIRPCGFDVSQYAIDDSPAHPRLFLTTDNCEKFSKGIYDRSEFDLVYSINVFHNLGYKSLKDSIREMVRVSRNNSYICVESYRNEEELCNLQCWALTCQSFYKPDDWLQIYEDCGYKGDYEFIYFT